MLTGENLEKKPHLTMFCYCTNSNQIIEEIKDRPHGTPPHQSEVCFFDILRKSPSEYN